MSEPTCKSSGMASQCTNFRESPPTTSMQASAAYERQALPPRSTISRMGLASVRPSCAGSSPSVCGSSPSARDELAHVVAGTRLERQHARDLLAHLFAGRLEELVELVEAEPLRSTQPRPDTAVPRVVAARPDLSFPEPGIGDDRQHLLVGERGVDAKVELRLGDLERPARRVLDERPRAAPRADGLERDVDRTVAFAPARR